MQTQFLESNPFYILEVTPRDKRANIIAKAEEKAFFLEGSICEEAQTSLLNPAKRLSAEIGWFCDVSNDTLLEIRDQISKRQEIGTDDLGGISKLNATINNLMIANFDDYFEIGYAILDIDEQYSAVDLAELTEVINSCHTQAGMRTVAVEEIEQEYNKKREQIRQLISEKIQILSDDDYIEFITMVAEKYIADNRYADEIIIADVVDQYELKMQSSIEEASEIISSHIEKIKKLSNSEGINSNLTGLIRRIKKWDRLVQPLQLKSMASGVTHRISENIGYEIRDLALWLHNEKNLTQSALDLVKAMKDIFAEIGSLSDIFSNDAKALSKIINEEKELGQIVDEIKSIERVISEWKRPGVSTNPYILSTNEVTKDRVNNLIGRIKAANERIEANNVADEVSVKLRERLCYTAREGAIYIHNERHQTDFALHIAKMLLEEFGDIDSLRGTLSEDVAALNRQAVLQATAARPTYRVQHQTSSSASNNKGCFVSIVVIAVILLFIVIISGVSSDDSSGKYTPNSSGNNSSFSQPSEKKFSSSSAVGTEVYADIVSIFPSIGIYTEGSAFYSDFVCECETSSGATVWVYMSTSEYQRYFDADASTSVFESSAEDITFPTAKRIHGVAKKVDSVMSGLSNDTGATILINFDSVE